VTDFRQATMSKRTVGYMNLAIMGLAAAGSYRVEMTDGPTGDPSGSLEVESSTRVRFDVGPIVSGFLVYDGRAWTGKRTSWVELPAKMAEPLTASLLSYVAAERADERFGLRCSTVSLEGNRYRSFEYEVPIQSGDGRPRARVRLLADSERWVPVRREIMAGDSLKVQRVTYDPSIRISPPH
jgi:hypothetical protein